MNNSKPCFTISAFDIIILISRGVSKMRTALFINEKEEEKELEEEKEEDDNEVEEEDEKKRKRRE